MPLQRWVPLSRPRIGPRTWDGGQASFEGRPDTRWSGRAPPRQQRGRSRFRPADCIRTEEITLDIASPIQGGRLLIPAPCGLLKPAPDLVGTVRMLSIERAALEHTLDRLGHVEPAAAYGRVERHDPMRAQPQHQLGRLVASEIVPHQQEPQRRQVMRQGEGHGQTRLPHRPGRSRSGHILR